MKIPITKMKVPIEVHELENILHYEDVGLILTDFRNRIFHARPRCVHKYYVQYKNTPRARILTSEGVVYYQELNRIERDCAFFRIDNRNANDNDWGRFARFEDL